MYNTERQTPHHPATAYASPAKNVGMLPTDPAETPNGKKYSINSLPGVDGTLIPRTDRTMGWRKVIDVIW